jgi:hypothetical protein
LEGFGVLKPLLPVAAARAFGRQLKASKYARDRVADLDPPS